MLLPSVSSAVVDIERFRHFLSKSLDGWSIVLFAVTGLLASLLGMVTPLVTRLIFGT